MNNKLQRIEDALRVSRDPAHSQETQWNALYDARYLLGSIGPELLRITRAAQALEKTRHAKPAKPGKPVVLDFSAQQKAWEELKAALAALDTDDPPGSSPKGSDA